MEPKKISYDVGTIFCYECVSALRRFVGSLKGVLSVEVEADKVAVSYDPGVLSADEVTRIVTDSVERLGYKVLGEG